MTYAPAAARSLPQVPKVPFAAIIAAVVIAGVVLFAALVQLGTTSTAGQAEFSRHVLASQRMWEAERLAQLGYLDPADRSAREWERQHRQLTGTPN